jgi:hypothetical protein
MRYLILLMIAVQSTFGTVAFAEECCDPDSPFREGEGMADIPATCETAADWIDRAPDYDGRITFSIRDALSDVSEDAALAYLMMCDGGPVQVLCVTYHAHERQPGDRVLMAGGYNNYDGSMIVLDPCMAWSEDAKGSGAEQD